MRFKSGWRALSISVALAITLSLAGCMGKTNIQITQPSCSTNCPPTPEFLYATSANHILAFSINPSTGALGTPLSMAGPNQSTGMVASNTLGHTSPIS